MSTFPLGDESLENGLARLSNGFPLVQELNLLKNDIQ